MDFCIKHWDPRHKGMVEEPHHNTYDIEFWGPDGMCTSFYLGALQAAVLMGKALGDEVPLYGELLSQGIQKAESDLFNGEYFFQQIEWKNLHAKNPLEDPNAARHYSPEAAAICQKEGPKYQYGTGCLSDGVLGSWLALVCGVGRKVERMRREEEIARLDDISAAMERVVKDRRREIEEDPLFVHPAEVKERLAEIEAVQRSLRPAPVVLHLDGLRVKIPYQEWKDTLAAVEVYGHRLGDIATLSDSRLGGSTLIRIKTRSEVEAQDASAKK
jgi:hypothetical protein